MYIINKHLQILKLIKNNNKLTAKEIGDLFSMSPQHVKLYLDDIYSELYNSNSKNLKSDLLITKISNSKNSRNKLKKNQEFSKNEKIFYLLFCLIKSRYLNLSNISEELEVTKRNLNYYLSEIVNILKKYNLKLKSTNKGLQLIGTQYSIKKFTYFIILKFFIEKEFLPTKIRNEMVCFLKVNNFVTVKKDLYKLISLICSEYTTHKTSACFCFYFVFKAYEVLGEMKVKDMDEKYFIRHKPKHFEDNFFKEIVYFLKNSCFGDLPTKYLSDFIILVDLIHYYHKKFDPNILKQSKILRDIFANYMGDKVYHNKYFYNLINPWLSYNNLKTSLSIEDLSFLNLNLNHICNSNVLQLTKDIQKIIPSFTVFETISIWYQLSDFEEPNIKNIFVFRDIHTNIIPLIINEIYKKHNIKILDYVNIKFLNRYLNDNKVDSIVTIENLKLYKKDIPVKNIFIPIPNFKKLNP